MYKLSLIVSVYKKINKLKLILYALGIQTFKDFEIIIADDGSGKEMDDFVEDFKRNSGLKINYLTQPHNGFGKNRILNQAIRNSNTRYLIFLDGDCVPHSDFIKAHFENIKKDTVLCGRRVFLGEKLSSMFNKEYVLNKIYQKNNFKILIDSFKKEKSSKYFEEGLVFKNKLLRKSFNLRKNHILGCNFSVQKDLMEKINGFDENYNGAGIGEDTDIEYRLSLINAKFLSVRNLAIVYHLYHEKTVEEKTNYEYFHNNISKSGNYFCKNGLIKVK
jgi:glycosyltransferase involved in cell wall biosynthesis